MPWTFFSLDDSWTFVTGDGSSGAWGLVEATAENQALFEDCCCVPATGCCPETITLPTIADDPAATKLQIEITDITIGGAECCLNIADIGTGANMVASAPLFWKCCTLLPDCIRGLTFTCANNVFVLQWANTADCPDPPANPLSLDTWELVSGQCDPFEFVFRYVWLQAFPETCEGSTMTVKITKQP